MVRTALGVSKFELAIHHQDWEHCHGLGPISDLIDELLNAEEQWTLSLISGRLYGFQ